MRRLNRMGNILLLFSLMDWELSGVVDLKLQA